jgi:hypothetical protein
VCTVSYDALLVSMHLDRLTATIQCVLLPDSLQSGLYVHNKPMVIAMACTPCGLIIIMKSAPG